ncbi:MAG: riboflavin synthase [Burkholderiales bacterium]|nr:riboflavin synthase [Burkholderiales bacterium]
MFTGIVAALGRIGQVTPVAQGARLSIEAPGLGLDDVAIGDSIAVNGVCLTVTQLSADRFGVDVSPQTLACTAGFELGAAVNLEKALRLSDRLGGHLVSGHVDGSGEVVRFEAIGDNRLLAVRLPAPLLRYVAQKGSITVNGVSLTVNAIAGDVFEVNLIPHTLAATNLHALRPGARVNLEVDLIARYLERMTST